MEEIKKKFKKDYERSVKEFNEREYDMFFRNIRPTTEWLSKLLIYDFMRDDVLANQIIRGEKSFELQQD